MEGCVCSGSVRRWFAVLGSWRRGAVGLGRLDVQLFRGWVRLVVSGRSGGKDDDDNTIITRSGDCQGPEVCRVELERWDSCWP